MFLQSNIVFCVETMKLVASRRVKVEKAENEMKVQVIKTTLIIRVFSVEFSLSLSLCFSVSLSGSDFYVFTQRDRDITVLMVVVILYYSKMVTHHF